MEKKQATSIFDFIAIHSRDHKIRNFFSPNRESSWNSAEKKNKKKPTNPLSWRKNRQHLFLISSRFIAGTIKFEIFFPPIERAHGIPRKKKIKKNRQIRYHGEKTGNIYF